MESFAPSSHRILVVDDTAVNRRLYGAILRKNGFFVTTASGGPEALSKVAEECPSLVLLDYMMPGMSGIDVLRQLRNNQGTTRLPVVMLTASSEPDHIDAALAAGANDYITKPVNAKLLVARLKSMIRASEVRQQATQAKRTDAILADLQEAARVQQAQLPDVPFKWNDYRVTGAVVPSGEVGGDLFDIVATKDRCVAFLLDVSGHGTASALVAAEIRAEFRHLLSRAELPDAMSRLNRHLAQRATGKYCCLGAVELWPGRIRIVNAGLPPAAILRGRKVVHQIWGSGMPVGMFEGSEYESTDVEVLAGDSIVFLSDGLTEPFGETDDAVAAVERLALWPSVDDEVPDGNALGQRIRAVTRASAPELRDDATALLLRLSNSVQEHLKLLARPEGVARAVRWVIDLSPSWVDRDAVDHGLTEALTNAILHGALGITSDLRNNGRYVEYLHLSQELPDRAELSDRYVELKVVSNPETFGVRLAWQGTPCPPDARDAKEQAGIAEFLAIETPTSLETSGMGLRIIFNLFDRVEWDEDGLGMEMWMQRALAGRDRTQPPPAPDSVTKVPSG